MNESIWIDCDGETAAVAAARVLTRRGFQVVRSFDLRSAQAAHVDCACPYHGTAECTCQYVVLLVYAPSGALAVLTLHGRDAQTHAQIVRDAYNRPEAGLVEQILAALLEAVLELHMSPTQLAEAPADAS